MHIVRGDQTAHSFSPDAVPVLTVPTGEPVRFETSSQLAERLLAAGDGWLETLDVHEANTVTGPVYIEGVKPDDTVAVEILDIELEDWGFTAAIPGLGLLGKAIPKPMIRRVSIRDNRVWLKDRTSLAVHPMIGCLGLAPAQGETSAMRPPRPWAGNFDLPQVTAGSTILFPAQVPGGLFSLGDLHAAMGTGEAASVAIECAGAATVRFAIRPGVSLTTPRIETADRIYTIGLDANDTPPPNGDYPAARVQAVSLMFEMLTQECGLTPEDAYVLIAAAVDLEFGGPAAAVVLAGVPRSMLQ